MWGALGLDDTVSIATQEDADKVLNLVSTERSRLDAYQNRLEHAYNANMNTAENLTAARYCEGNDEHGKVTNIIAGKPIRISDAHATSTFGVNVVR